MSMLLLDDESSDEDCCIVDSQRVETKAINDVNRIDVIGGSGEVCDRPGKVARLERATHSNVDEQSNDCNHKFDNVLSKMRNVRHTPATAPAKVFKMKATTIEWEEEQLQEMEKNSKKAHTVKKLFTSKAKQTKENKGKKSYISQHRQQATNGESEEELEEEKEEEEREEKQKLIEHLPSSIQLPISLSPNELEKLKSGGGDGLLKMDAFVFGATRISMPEHKSTTNLVDCKEVTTNEADSCAKEHSNKADVILLDDSIDDKESQHINHDIISVDTQQIPDTTMTTENSSVINTDKLASANVVNNCEYSPRSTLESTISPLQQTSTQESCTVSPAPSPHSPSVSHSGKQMNLTDFFTRLSCSKKEKEHKQKDSK